MVELLVGCIQKSICHPNKSFFSTYSNICIKKWKKKILGKQVVWIALPIKSYLIIAVEMAVMKQLTRIQYHQSWPNKIKKRKMIRIIYWMQNQINLLYFQV